MEICLRSIQQGQEHQLALEKESQQVFSKIQRDLEAIKKSFTSSLQKEVSLLRAEITDRLQVGRSF